jgi:hypothetical protein
VPSSTSSSNSRLPTGPWLAFVAVAAAVTLGSVAWLEWRLSSRGFVPTAMDTEALWQTERRRASELGASALVLVGNSRVQLDIDTRVLAKRTGLQPVQLALDGSPFLPVLENLARDPSITGTVLVGYTDGSLAQKWVADSASIYARNYESEAVHVRRFDYSWAEARLDRWRHELFRSYADGTRPITALLLRAVASEEEPQYIVTMPDRSRAADYSRVSMPEFYFNRVRRNIGNDTDLHGRTDAEREAELSARIRRLTPVDNRLFLSTLPRMRAATEAIEARGGKVLLVVMPTSGLVRESDEKLFPPDRFVNHVIPWAGRRFIDASASPRFSRYRCPDGSHLDRRDRAGFTDDLVDEIGAQRFGSR